MSCNQNGWLKDVQRYAKFPVNKETTLYIIKLKKNVGDYYG